MKRHSNPEAARRGQLGYCSSSLGQTRSMFRGARASALDKRKEADSRLKRIWRHNLEELCRVLDYNLEVGILLYRIGDLFPHADSPRHLESWHEFSSAAAGAAAWKVRQYLAAGGRLTMHPKQSVSLGSPSKSVRKKSIDNLEMHARTMDFLGLPATHFAPINIHLGSGRDGEKSARRISSCLEAVGDGVRLRLVLENEDKAFWTWQNIARLFPGYPITLDSHHHRINNHGEGLREAAEATRETWGEILPVRHVAEGARSSGDREHHDWVRHLPGEFLSHGRPSTDIEVEAKMKDLAVLFLKSKYGC